MDADAPPTVIGLNPFEPGFYDDPYRQYAEIQATRPIHKSDLGPWLVTRWDDVHAVLRKPGTSVEERNIAHEGPSRREQLADLVEGREARRSRAILNIDPPDHTRIRRLVSKAFTPRAVEQIRARTGEMVEEILDDLATREGPVDLISELAFPLPFAVISEMLGMPEGDRDQLRTWSHLVTQFLDPILAFQNAEAIFEASDNMWAVVNDAIAWKRARGDEGDLLSALIAAEDDGDTLSDAELVENVVLLFLAGHETTVNLIGNGTTRCSSTPTSEPGSWPTPPSTPTPWRSCCASTARCSSRVASPSSPSRSASTWWPPASS
ncbi:MAG: cytochrome P450 [Acidimicrobiales bacterium]